MRRGLRRRRRRSFVVCGRANLSSVHSYPFAPFPSLDVPLDGAWLVRLVRPQLNLVVKKNKIIIITRAFIIILIIFVLKDGIT